MGKVGAWPLWASLEPEILVLLLGIERLNIRLAGYVRRRQPATAGSAYCPQHFGNCICRGASTRRACAGRMPTLPWRSRYYGLCLKSASWNRGVSRLGSGRILKNSFPEGRCLTFANFVNFCSNFLCFLLFRFILRPSVNLFVGIGKMQPWQLAFGR